MVNALDEIVEAYGEGEDMLNALDELVQAYGEGEDEVQETDVFNKLSEDVVADILSRLDSRQAVQTSVFSREWERRWMTMRKVRIDVCEAGLNNKTFIKFLEKLLPLQLKEFIFSAPHPLPPDVVLRLKSLSGTELLEVVELCTDSLIQSPFFYLSHPALTTLLIHFTHSVTISLETSPIYKFKFSNVTDLDLKNITFSVLNWTRITIEFVSLVKFTISFCSWPVSFVTIDAPNLLYFMCNNNKPSFWELKLRGGNKAAIHLGGQPVFFDFNEFDIASAFLFFDEFAKLDLLVPQLWKVETFGMTQSTAKNLAKINFKHPPQWTTIQLVRSEEEIPTINSFKLLVKIGELLKECSYIEASCIDLKMDADCDYKFEDDITTFHNCIKYNLETMKKIHFTSKGFDNRTGYLRIALYLLRTLKVHQLVIWMGAAEIENVRQILDAEPHSTKLDIQAE